MARSSATFQKRQKERARQEKQRAKMERRQQRKLEKASGAGEEAAMPQDDVQAENPSSAEESVQEESI